ncbi:hypothetical protein [Pseudomonas amygdali]|uniref:hypothetical protein n=1 Tax=Pseudomonas amygdali TaxID=47877 RepID=UPI003AF3D54B
MVAFAFDLGLFPYASAQAVVLIAAGAFHLRISHGIGFDQAVFAVVGEGLPAHDADSFFDQVAPGVVFVFVVAPLFEAVVFDVVEAAGVEVQAVGRCVVAELFTIDDQAVVTRQQLAVGFVFVVGFAAQFVEVRLSSPYLMIIDKNLTAEYFLFLKIQANSGEIRLGHNFM